MNVFNKYTLKSLRENRTRTVVTIIGIILSVAMFTSVTESMVSGQSYLVENVKRSIGTFHYSYNYISPQTLEKMQSDSDFASVSYVQNTGYALFGSSNENKPYIHVAAMSENFTDNVAVQLIDGRMPQNSSELLVSRHSVVNGGWQFNIGDTVVLEMGQRMLDGNVLWQDIPFSEDEAFKPLYTKSYTVVGICQRPDEKIEPYQSPGYTCYTVEEKQSDVSCHAFVTAANPKNAEAIMSEKTESYGYPESYNRDLLTLEGYGDDELSAVVFGLGALLIVLIMAGSVALIYNSFSISVSERIKQFGILRSVGATKRQLKKAVSFEAAVLCAAAIPVGLAAGCGGIALTFRLLSGEFDILVDGFIDSMSGNMHIHLVPSVPALVCAAVISIVTVLISARIPLKKALKISAIEAVRMSSEVKEKKKKIKTPAFIYKLFGFSGFIAHRNFSRNRRRYRTVIASLTASFVLFVSASSLCNYFTSAFDMGTDIDTCDIEIGLNGKKTSEDEEKNIISQIAQINGVKEYAVERNYEEYLIVGKDEVSSSFIQYDMSEDALFADGLFSRHFIDDEQFASLVKSAGAANVDFFNKEKPAAILYDNIERYAENEKGKDIYVNYQMFPINKTPYTLTLYSVKYETDGWFYSYEKETNGNFTYIKGDKTKTFSSSECLNREDVIIGGRIEKNTFYIQDRSTVLLYPESMREAVMKDFDGRCQTDMYLLTKDHRAVADELEGMISEGDDFFYYDNAKDNDAVLSFTKVIRVFSYGFITLISLICAANVFNTVSTNITLRRRENAILRSIGMGEKAFGKMFDYESLIYGVKALMWGIPLCCIVSTVMYVIVSEAGFDTGFLVPWGSVAVAVISIFAVVFASMFYSAGKVKDCNIVDELKNENI